MCVHACACAWGETRSLSEKMNILDQLGTKSHQFANGWLTENLLTHPHNGIRIALVVPL